MTGFLFMGVSVIWLVVCLLLTLWLAGRFENIVAKLILGLGLFALLLPLPILDEIRAQSQMTSLCKEGTVLNIDTERIRGRRVRLAFEPSNARVEGAHVPILYTRVVFRDASSDEVLGSFVRYNASGGIFIQVLGISSTSSPVWVRPEYCGPDIGVERMAEKYQFEIAQ